MYDRKTVAAVRASATLALVAIIATLWRLVMGLRAAGLL